ncbi:hypothetical protein AWZ03_013796 [Drosophila navojoa]|uniref:Uncharacterized protein n=1 Tax=Drosophila navojoa TaxID=7232 RepID=A0A484AUR5_DRONA|nr:hypothetical protein AWZ03_013796 [Drosophila navojoa]
MEVSEQRQTDSALELESELELELELELESELATWLQSKLLATVANGRHMHTLQRLYLIDTQRQLALRVGELPARLTVHFAMQRANFSANNNGNSSNSSNSNNKSNNNVDDDLFKPRSASFLSALGKSATPRRCAPKRLYDSPPLLALLPATAALCILPLHLPLEINFRATAGALEQWANSRGQTTTTCRDN